MTQATKTMQRQGVLRSRKSKRMLFSILMIALPLLQFVLFYIYVNFNSIIMAFKFYEVNADGLGYKEIFAGLNNFSFAVEYLRGSGKTLMYSLIYFLCTIVIGMGFSLIFAYYITKKYTLSGLFKTILFLPQITSSAVFAILYKYIVTDVYATVFLYISGSPSSGGLLDGSVNSQYLTILFYNLWISFGVQVLLFSNAMSAIDNSIIESAKLDGASTVKEFIHITVPIIYPTFVAFFVVHMAGIFTTQMSMLPFFSTSGKNKFDVVGFYLFRNALKARNQGTQVTYPQLAALGVLLTVILAPVTIGVRKLMIKFGPSAD